MPRSPTKRGAARDPRLCPPRRSTNSSIASTSAVPGRTPDAPSYPGSSSVVARFAQATRARTINHTDVTTRLPNELVDMVLQHLSSDDALAASHVCRLWRCMALARATLWTTLALRLSEPEDVRWHQHVVPHAPRAMHNSLEVLADMLSRSKAEPLTIYASLSSYLPATTMAALRKLLDTNAHRIVELRVLYESPRVLRAFPHLERNTSIAFPALRRLALDHTMEDESSAIHYTAFLPFSDPHSLLLADHTARFPNLEACKAVQVHWADAPHDTYPQLRRAGVSGRWVSGLVWAAPALEEVHIHVHSVVDHDIFEVGTTPEQHDEIVTRLRSIQSIVISGSCAWHLDVDLFGTLDMGAPRRLVRLHCTKLWAAAAILFEEFAGIVRFSHRIESGDTHILVAENERSDVRVLTAPFNAASEKVWSQFYERLNRRRVLHGVPISGFVIHPDYEGLVRRAAGHSLLL
ncbi:hypothetical protein EXIGLDRAFT_764006 [Exidia glandulosa HHB12029]|uniref:F-box domain-containing protein n=1 Tax=Exidia glandulosa HHB12029 TaxID=1314781 RepID=A0A166B572_EXIGL|nr:hypothetical protein EXIGLDRAFT_764006 [Exidia glandulosa HHB12029]